MSKFIEEAQSFNAAVARARGASMVATMVALATSADLAALELPRDGFEHNIGDCGCGGTGSCGGGPSCVCRRPGTGGDVMYLRMPDGSTVAVTPTGGDPGVAAVVAVPSMPVLPGNGNFNPNMSREQWNEYVANGFPNGCVPYRDAVRDAINMVPVVSNAASIAAGATAVLTWAPPQGWLDAYYIDFAIRTATGTATVPEGIDISYPVVTGCPVSSCIPTTAINGRFMTAIDGCCNGRPFRAIVQRATDGGVLTASVTNNTAATQTVQGVLRGFCVSSRLCA